MKIGWIGTGVMGNAMCGHLIDAGHQLSIFNRTRDKAANLMTRGARWYDTPADVARHSDTVFTIVGYPQDVEQVYLGDQGILAAAGAGATIVDMTTSSPDLAVRIYQAAAERDVSALDAPVSGGDIGAREATLAIMIGGDKPRFETIRPLFENMGRIISYMGPAGSGQHTKMCNQILVAGNMIGMVESMLYAHRSGMDQKAVIDVIGKGAASSWAVNNIGPRIVQNDFAPGFFIKHFVKDMGIALDECRRMNLTLPGLALVNQFYIAAMAHGESDLGTQGLYRVLARLNNVIQ